jgi:hypothetical protein
MASQMKFSRCQFSRLASYQCRKSRALGSGEKAQTSAMYGSAAMGGVINAISLLPKEFYRSCKIHERWSMINPPAGVKAISPGINRPYFYSGNVLIGDQGWRMVLQRGSTHAINDPGATAMLDSFYSDNINLSVRYQLSANQSLQLSSVLNWAEGGVAYGWTNVGDPLGVPPGPVFSSTVSRALSMGKK